MEINFITVGMTLILIGFAVIFLGGLASSQGNTNVAIGGFLGPIPFGWANDKKLLPWIIGLSVIGIVIFLIFSYFTH